MRVTKLRRRFMAATAISIFLAASSAAASAAEQTYQFDIPAESLSQALTDYSQASSQQIFFTEDVVKGRSVKGLHGRYTAQQALDALLAGTDLKIETNSSGVMMVRSKNVQAASNEGAASVGNADVETVVVTGTHLRNVESLTPVTTITSKEMLDQGYSTLTDAIQQLPQNFKAGASTESAPPEGVGGPNNYGFASGINLRGLGSADTLVLLNGQRLPSTALGSTVDISGIPLSAIDRVEILTDGASAIYGADAVSGVVNIITKHDYEGIETGYRMDSIANGKQPNWGGYALGGFDWDTGGALANVDFEQQEPLLASKRSYTDTALNPTMLLPRQSVSSAYVSLNQEITSDLRLSSDLLYSFRPYQANNLFAGTGSLIVTGHNGQLAGNVDIEYTPFSDWAFSLVGQLSRENDLYDPNYVGFGESLPERLTYGVKSLELQTTGTLFSLPGGDVHIAVGGSVRAESFHDVLSICTPACSPNKNNDVGRTVMSVYGEVLIPIIGTNNSVPLVQELRVDAAARFDHYDSFGGTTNPKVTIQWVPTDGVTLHGSYATSFKAPTLVQLYNAPNVYGIITAANPADPSAGNALEWYEQSNPNLRPETAKTYTFGSSITPNLIPGLKVDASYFNINYSNEIVDLSDTFLFTDVLNGQLGSFLTANPTLTQINNQLASDNGGNFCYVANCSASTIKAIANLSSVNASSVKLSGLDLSANYDFSTDIGQFKLNADATDFLSYVQYITPAASATPGAGVIYTPPRFRGKFNVGWYSGAWSANARLNYTGSEKNTHDPSCASGPCPISSWTTVDLSASYAFNDVPKAVFLNGTRISISVENIFNTNPPYAFAPTGVNYDGVNANPLGRVFTVSVVKRW